MRGAFQVNPNDRNSRYNLMCRTAVTLAIAFGTSGPQNAPRETIPRGIYYSGMAARVPPPSGLESRDGREAKTDRIAVACDRNGRGGCCHCWRSVHTRNSSRRKRHSRNRRLPELDQRPSLTLTSILVPAQKVRSGRKRERYPVERPRHHPSLRFLISLISLPRLRLCGARPHRPSRSIRPMRLRHDPSGSHDAESSLALRAALECPCRSVVELQNGPASRALHVYHRGPPLIP